ncbi:glutamate--cysteine ligase 2 [Arthrobacter crystallopoietes]|uniref:Putative glutamate--cysteine ligase 2 n=1 Tax=Crystallibacter crystallopoietes TaxID=37928 RepID=A0A1H1FZX7_9MICC|nr:glutamate--cysteine ligase [Arthrobacter crystallopoietes]AUI52845.1 carboxylate--amine ligase [Arthrobacter crystallopoietes]SDR06473.1 carboxylate-amine ligase [Arthrobacter crystallopoietes]
MRTFGVEEELLLVDPGSGAAVPMAGQVMDLYARSDLSGIAPEAGVRAVALTHEFVQEQIETATAVHTTLHGLAEDILAGRARADFLARQVGARAIALGTAPLPAELHTVRLPRFEAIRNQLGLTAVQQLTCACHVHVGIRSPEEGVAVLDRIRVWLPALAALSANSPFWDGTDTGYASFRTQLWGRWPTTGPTEIFGSADAYRRLVRDLLATGVLLDEGMVYFDARLSRTYPTVEIRVSDVCLNAKDAVLIAALTRALVETAARQWRSGRPPPVMPAPLLKLAAWQASRHGIEAELLHPLDARPYPAEDVIGLLLDHTLPALADVGDDAWAEDLLRDLLRRGNGSRQQRNAYRDTRSFTGVVAEALKHTGTG